MKKYKIIYTPYDLDKFLENEKELTLYFLPEYTRNIRTGKINYMNSLILYNRDEWFVDIKVKTMKKSYIKAILEIIFSQSHIYTYDLYTFMSQLPLNAIPDIEIINVTDIAISQFCLPKNEHPFLNITDELHKRYRSEINTAHKSKRVMEILRSDTSYVVNIKMFVELLYFPYFSESIKQRIEDSSLENIDALEQQVNVIISTNLDSGFKVDLSKVIKIENGLEKVRAKLCEKIKSCLAPSSYMSVSIPYIVNMADINRLLMHFGKIDNPLSEAELYNMNHIPVIKYLIKLKKIGMELGNIHFLKKFTDDRSGCLISELNQFGTDTGRITSSGYNYQSVQKRKDYRSCFIPSEGNKLVVADYSQSELIIGAHLAQDNKLIQAIKDKRDLHQITAHLILGKPMDQITPDERKLGKGLNFGILYGMGSATLQEVLFNKFDIIVSEIEAQSYIENFFLAYSGLKEWRDNIPTTGHYTSKTALGRTRHFYEEEAPKRWNSLLQSTGADLIKTAMVILYPKLKEIDGNIVAFIHDELVIEVHRDRAKEAEKLLEKSMIDAGAGIIDSVPITVNSSIRDSWWM